MCVSSNLTKQLKKRYSCKHLLGAREEDKSRGQTVNPHQCGFLIFDQKENVSFHETQIGFREWLLVNLHRVFWDSRENQLLPVFFKIKNPSLFLAAVA